MRDDDELEAKGYEFTEWDCPECGDVNRAEGDIKGEQHECDNCGAEVWIT